MVGARHIVHVNRVRVKVFRNNRGPWKLQDLIIIRNGVEAADGLNLVNPFSVTGRQLHQFDHILLDVINFIEWINFITLTLVVVLKNAP